MDLSTIPMPSISQTLIKLHTQLGTSPAELSDLISNSIKDIIIQLENNAKEEINELNNTIDKCKRTIKHLYELMDESWDESLQINQMFLRQEAADWLAKLNEAYDLYGQRYEVTKSLYDQMNAFRVWFGNRMPLSNASIPPLSSKGLQCVSMDFMSTLEFEILKLLEEKTRQTRQCALYISQIISLWDILGHRPTSTFEFTLKRANTSNGEEMINILPITDENLAQLQTCLDQLTKDKETRQARVSEMSQELRYLWSMMDVPKEEQETYINRKWTGLCEDSLMAYERELDRMRELKRRNISRFIMDARATLKELWKVMFLTEEEQQVTFPEAFISIDGSQGQLLNLDSLLTQHEDEIEQLKNLHAKSAKIFDLVARYDTLLEEIREFQEGAKDASRLLNKSGRDPGRLLREEKFRKRVERERPRLEKELEIALTKWEQENGRPFTVLGANYLRKMRERIAGENEDKENRKKPKNLNNPAPSRAGSVSRRPITPVVPLVQASVKRDTTRKMVTPSGTQSRGFPTSTIPRGKYRSVSASNVREPLSQISNSHRTTFTVNSNDNKSYMRSQSSSLFTPQTTTSSHPTLELLGPSQDLPKSALYMATKGLPMPVISRNSSSAVSQLGLANQMGMPVTIEELENLDEEFSLMNKRDHAVVEAQETPCRRESSETVISLLVLGSPDIQTYR